VENMKKSRKIIVNAIVSMAKKGVREDVNSTGSPWMFQPKLPVAAEKLKKTKK
jgi:hypothetical protein